jgi:GTP-binding protein
MNISKAVFECSSPDLESCPDESFPEIAFIGRSNVGKSSLLNMLAGKGALARVSATPGHTKLINMFRINNKWRLVDLPGYGFAQVARQDKSKFNKSVADYLENRPNLCCVFSLIDSSLPPQKIDLEFVEWLAECAIPCVLVFTKTDTVKPGKLAENIKAFTDKIANSYEKLPEIYSCSAITREGRGQLLKLLDDALAEAEVEAPETSEAEPEIETEMDSPKPEPTAAIEEEEEEKLPPPWKLPAKNTLKSSNKSRPDRARPW